MAEVEKLDHPWAHEYFHGPRARAAQDAREREARNNGQRTQTQAM
jgi:phospholipid/cholesterol/gamma-HCH transport system ATP-binding protein